MKNTKVRLYLFCFIFVLPFCIYSEDTFTSSENLNSWKKALKEYNYTIPEELEKRFISSNRNGAGIKNEILEMYIRKVSYNNEQMNYGIYIRSRKTETLSSGTFYLFLFNNDLLNQVTTQEYYHDSLNRNDYVGESIRLGLTIDYQNGRPFQISCLHKKQNLTDPRQIFTKDYCGDIINLNEEGEVVKVTTTVNQCVDPCTRYLPFKEPGIYYIMGQNVRMRNSSDSKSDILKVLQSGEKVELIEDSYIAEYIRGIDFATWAKVRLEDNTEGYIYGAFLRAPGEPDILEIKKKANDWKKKQIKK